MTTLLNGKFLATAAVAAVLLLAPAAQSFGDAPKANAAAHAGDAHAAQPNTLSDAEQKAGFKLLFDGKTTQGWRGYKKDKASPGWKVVDGALVRADKNAGDILTDEQFDAFELLLDWRIAPEGNSGLIFHVTEEEGTPWMTGPEIQIQDNVKGHDPQKAGWLYQLYQPAQGENGQPVDATKPAGQWNTMRVLLAPAGRKSEVWMNGVKYYEFVKGGDDWDQRVAKSKFGKMPKFGKPTKGHLCLQDHGDEVAFRNIKVRPIKAAEQAP